VAYRLVRVVQALVSQDNTTKNLVVVSGATVYLADGVTTATVYSDATGTAMSNPVPTGVTPGPTAAGIDTAGNFNAWVDPTLDYALLVNGIKVPLQTSSVHHKDVTDHFDGTVSDPHGDRAWALATFTTGGGGSTGEAVFG
jgi:hypothetical protein